MVQALNNIAFYIVYSTICTYITTAYSLWTTRVTLEHREALQNKVFLHSKTNVDPHTIFGLVKSDKYKFRYKQMYVSYLEKN